MTKSLRYLTAVEHDLGEISVPQHNPVSEFYGQFLRPHGLVFALTCTVNCGTLYRQLRPQGCLMKSHTRRCDSETQSQTRKRGPGVLRSLLLLLPVTMLLGPLVVGYSVTFFVGRKRGGPRCSVVGITNNNLPSYAHLGTSRFEVASSLSNDSSTVNDGGLCAGWIAQPAATALQPMNHWSYPEYLQQHDPTTLPLTTDMYMVGPSSILTYTHTPLFTNFGTLAPTSTALPQVDLQDSVLTYIPWTQPLTTIPTSGVQFASHPATLAGSQLLPMSMTVTPTMPQQDPQPLEQSPAGAEEPNPLEKLLEYQDQDDKYTYVNSSSIFIPSV